MKDPKHIPHWLILASAIPSPTAVGTTPFLPVKGCNEYFEPVSNDPSYEEQK